MLGLCSDYQASLVIIEANDLTKYQPSARTSRTWTVFIECIMLSLTSYMEIWKRQLIEMNRGVVKEALPTYNVRFLASLDMVSTASWRRCSITYNELIFQRVNVQIAVQSHAMFEKSTMFESNPLYRPRGYRRPSSKFKHFPAPTSPYTTRPSDQP